MTVRPPNAFVRFLPWIAGGALIVWVCFLRGPSFGHLMWNVDETIHAAIAQLLLDGGTLYTDAIDQRTPLTYHVFAVMFGLAGPSLVPVRVLVAVLIAIAAWLLGRTASRIHGLPTGIGAALAFVAFSTHLLFPGDVLAVHTEWFVLFFTTAAAAVFLGGFPAAPSTPRIIVTALLLALATLSKQSALLEILPPILTLAGLAIFQTRGRASALRGIILTSIIFVAVIGGCFAVYAIKGAGPDFLFYTWTYNLQYYGAEYTFVEKVLSASLLAAKLGEIYPALLITGTGAIVWLIVRVLQIHPAAATEPRRRAEVYLLAWLIFSLGAAMAGGRGYDHYFFPVLAPLAWLVALIPGRLLSALSSSTPPPLTLRIGAGVLGLFLLFGVVSKPLSARKLPVYGPDPALRVSEFIRQQSSPADRLFVWGFNPDIYYYSQRLPATRFLYCTFQTGLIPWSNIADDVDTAYAIVPGSMDQLLADLVKTSPRFIIDSSPGVHRHFDKYPISKFPRLHDWIAAHYVELESQIFVGHGFRVWVRSGADNAAAINATGIRTLTQPQINPGISMGSGLHHIRVSGQTLDLKTRLTGIGLEVNGRVVAAVDLHEGVASRITVPVMMDSSTDFITVRALARAAGGVWEASDPSEITAAPPTTNLEQRKQLAISILTQSAPALRLQAQFGAHRSDDDGHTTLAVHAPGLIEYEVPANATVLRGSIGITPGAYAADNPHPSDGAEFIVRLRRSDGATDVLFRKTLQPLLRPDDVGDQKFRITFPVHRPGDILSLEINTGPMGNGASDWTYWRDLAFETSP